ncbi:MAG: Fic family protein [Planctomycetes bacterium]|nr:Fic family protein [Planctomycetota bacterium]
MGIHQRQAILIGTLRCSVCCIESSAELTQDNNHPFVDGNKRTGTAANDACESNVRRRRTRGF